MKYSIVFSSRTGNTRLLADTIHDFLPEKDCIYFGEPGEQATEASRIFIGFWTDKGSCDPLIESFLKTLQGKEIFLFGTAGFGVDSSYFEQILNKTCEYIDDSNKIIGRFMCQGKMPAAVRERYEKMAEAPNPAPNIQMLIDNFDRALSHPDEADLENLKKAVHTAD